jgi:hypothetical protein
VPAPRYNVWGYGVSVLPPPIIVTAPPAYVVDGAPPPPVGYEEPPPPSASAILSGDLMLGRELQLAGAQLAIEGQRLGVHFAYTAAFAPIDGTDDRVTLHLAQARMTYALIHTARSRLRLEFGAHLASAPDVTFLAPGIGLSAASRLIGPLGVEGRVFGNLWPYTQLDARAGVTLSAGPVGASFGMRALYLDDNGVLGAKNAGDTSDFFVGPSVLLAIAL